MIKATRSHMPNFNPDPGVTRTLIGSWYVEWVDVMPTLAEVELFLNPTQDQIDALAPEKAAVRKAVTQAVADNDAFLSLASPTNNQRDAYLKSVARQLNAIIKRLVQI